MQGTIFIVDDNVDFARFLMSRLRGEGFDAHVAGCSDEAKRLVSGICPDIVLMDLRLPDGDGIELMKELKVSSPHSQFIMMTAFGSIETAIQSMRHGAFDYLTKPFNDEELILILHNALQRNALNEEVQRLRGRRPDFRGEGRVHPPYPSARMSEIMALAAQTAKSSGNLLITGDSGVGKNYLARIIHRMSPRAEGPFFDLSCTSIAPSLIESELFGYEPGAFTGSKGRKRGLLELADGGCLFLDEIGDLDPSLQSRLLAFLETRTLRRLGGETNIKVDARIIAATNRNLEDLVKNGRFREDLYYRLNVLAIPLPPLRERKEDLPILVQEICLVLGQEMGLRETPEVSPEAMKIIIAYDWPGNIRELRNVLERALISAPDKGKISEISIKPIKPEVPPEKNANGDSFTVPFPAGGISLKDVYDDLTRNLILEALHRAKTKNQAAAMLGISRFSLAHYMRSLGLNVKKPHME